MRWVGHPPIVANDFSSFRMVRYHLVVQYNVQISGIFSYQENLQIGLLYYLVVKITWVLG